ncbi:uncharacterized protein LOC132903674 [Amyelois transitella]|uniref:uncharacterized protein LOC132903674 n=1 Tax=Amyelois transitella TaxID=680683 RepID=UPI0029904FCA|nr:uncharacterized protein LOC132903674 [Amyelois transitella]
MHMWTLKHMKNVMSPINDENCIRQSNRDKKHCVICNEMIGNVALHKRMSTYHLKRLKSALVVNRNVSDDTKLEATLPDLAANNLESNDDVKENIPDNVQKDCLHYTMSLTHNPKDLLCKVCDKVVIATPNNVSEHVNGISHKNKYDKLLSVNRLRKVRDGFACDGCKLFIAHEDEIAHVDLKSHKNSMKKQIKNNQTYCEICYFYMDTYFYKTHKRGQRHKENAKEDRVSKRVCVDTDKKDSDVTAPVIVQSNINEDSVQTSPREVTPSVTDTALETKNQHNEDKNLLYQMKTTPLPSCLLCIVCEDVVTNDTNNITIHLNGPNHINNYNELLKINKVVRKDSGFHCDACDVAILDKNELEHIFGGQHKNNIGDRSLIRSGNSNVVSNSQKIKPPVVERRYLFKTSENSNELMCTICNEIIPNKTTNINDHSNSEKHKTEYESLLKLNRVFDFGNVLFCQACLKYIECQKEIYHIKEPSHKASLRLFKANRCLKSSSNATFEGYEVYCSICRTWVDDFRYDEHEISENHVLNIKRVSFGVLDLQKDSPETSESCLKCKLCDCNVPNMYAFIYEHVNKFIHKLLLHQALIENELYFINQDLCCKACMVAINIEDDFNHMYKPEHLENLIRFRNDMNVNVKSQD